MVLEMNVDKLDWADPGREFVERVERASLSRLLM
jgi:hypothetical protein